MTGFSHLICRHTFHELNNIGLLFIASQDCTLKIQGSDWLNRQIQTVKEDSLSVLCEGCIYPNNQKKEDTI